jgi:hypothetical protein
MQEERDLPGTQHTTSLCTFYRNAFHEAKTKKKKDFQPLTAKGQGSPTSKPPMGSRNIATYLTCTMSVVRLPACRWKRTLQPFFPSQGLFVGECATRKQIEYQKAEARSAPVGSLNLAPLAYWTQHNCLRNVRRERRHACFRR